MGAWVREIRAWVRGKIRAWGREVRALLCRETTGAGVEEPRGGARSDSPISADSVAADATPEPMAWAAGVCPARTPK